MDKRNYKLDMGYESMWSLLDDVSNEEIISEEKLITEELSTINKKISALQSNLLNKNRKLIVLSSILEERERIYLIKNLIVTDEHKKLLAEIDFLCNKDIYIEIRDVAKILNWELPNDDLSNEQYATAERLIKELPFALNKIIKTNQIKVCGK